MTQFPETLKTWRKARRFSQLELAMTADVSSRHISFLETGRANPSREMISRLGEALDLPLSTRNQMLTHAGFAARYSGLDWNSQEMAPIRSAVEYTLKKHAPYPAIAIDKMWNIVQANQPAQKLFALLGVHEGDSLIDHALSDAIPQFIENWSEVAHHMALRLRTESAASGGIELFENAAEKLSKAGDPADYSRSPVVPTIYSAGDLRLALFSTLAQFGTPLDLALDDLKIELFFPSDEPTKAILEAMA